MCFFMFTTGELSRLCRPRVHEYLKEMNREVLSSKRNVSTTNMPLRNLTEYSGLITVGETPLTHDMHEISKYVLPDNHELNMVFQFELMDIDSSSEDPLKPKTWKLTEFKEVINRWQTFLRERGFWNRYERKTEA